MMEPRRLVETCATEVERVLLNSARADAPPGDAAHRMLVALQGLGAAPAGLDPQPTADSFASASSAGGPVAGHALKMGVVTKLGLAGLVGAGLVGGGAFVYRTTRQPPAPMAAAAARTPATYEQPVAKQAARLGVGESATPEPPTETGAAPSSPSGSALHNRGKSSTDQSLTAEIRILDVARAAIDGHNPTAAQRALDSYAQRFPQGHLRPEASVLHLAVLVQQGHRPAARALAGQLLASPSYKTYEQRIRSLLRKAAGEQSGR
jgi:hypothetical protein